MINTHNEEMGIVELISLWSTKVKFNNRMSYFDINKASEGLALKLLNITYDWELVNLNSEKLNFPGIDLGDKTKSGIAVQVTSRSDTKKINDTLKLFHEKNYIEQFPNGVKIFILTDNNISNNKKTAAEYEHFFNYKEGIITLGTIMQDISNSSDQKKKKILDLLENELSPKHYYEKQMQQFSEIISRKSDSNVNLIALGDLLSERARRRIEKFIELEKDSWEYGYHVLSQDFIDKYQTLYSLEDDYKTRLHNILEKIDDGAALRLLFEEYIELETTHLNSLIGLLFTNQFSLLITTERSFQSLLRSMLDSLIDKYNENINILSKYFHVKLEYIENSYKDVNLIIGFNDIVDKQNKLQRLVNETKDTSLMFYVFFDSSENLDVTLEKTIPLIKLNGDQISMAVLISMLTAKLETISLRGEVFGASSKPADLIFLTPIENETKTEIALLQKRSYFRVYYFVEQPYK